MVKNQSHVRLDIYEALSEVCDPEIPVLTIDDLGVLRSVEFVSNEWVISITPTYSGCPAMNMIEANIRIAMAALHIENYRIERVLSPAWTTDWMSEEGRLKLEQYGIAPPNPDRNNNPVRCPICKSDSVDEISAFGSTACKSLWKCNKCLEPFDYFKCH